MKKKCDVSLPAEQVLDEAGHRWVERNQAAFEAFNRRVSEHGLLSDSAGLL